MAYKEEKCGDDMGLGVGKVAYQYYSSVFEVLIEAAQSTENI